MMQKTKGGVKIHQSSFSIVLILLLIVILGLILRLFHLQFYLDNGALDPMWYIHAAVNYINKGWLTSNATFKGPLLTSLLSLSIYLFNPTFIVTKFVSIISGTLLPVIVFLLGSELFSKKVGLLGAFIVSINPILIFYHTLVYREILFSLIWTASIYFAIRGFKGSILYSILGGIFFALSSLTIELGLFAGIGILLFVLLDSFFRSETALKRRYENLDIFFFSAFLTLVPFIVRNYLAYGDPFIQWSNHLEDLVGSLPISISTIMWIYIGLMALGLPYTIWLKLSRTRAPRLPKHYSFNSILRRYSKTIKITLVAFVVIIASLFVYEFSKGSGFIARSILGFIKLVEVLTFPETLGIFLLVFSISSIIITLKHSRDVAFVMFVLVFSGIGLTWGITTHYLSIIGLSFNEILLYRPYEPLDNAFRYVSSYLPLLAIFASYGIFMFSNNFVYRLIGYAKVKTKKITVVRTLVTLILISLFVLQFAYADSNLIKKSQRDSASLETTYSYAIGWLSSQGSPKVYCFNSLFREQYGQQNTVLLTNESLNDVALRATNEKIEYVITDIFGAYSEAQLSLFLGGFNEDPSLIGLSRFELVNSYKYWPMIQIFKISKVEETQTALVVQHEDWGQEWVSFLSKYYFVDNVNDENDLSLHFAGDYKLIVLTEIQRSLTDNELNILQQKVANGAVLILNGLSPAYIKLESNGDWIGGTNFVEAPTEARWDIQFTQNALNVSTEIDLNKSYALYSSSNYSSPTGLSVIGEDVVVYATRVEDDAAAIFAKPYLDGTIIFTGIRPSYATSAKDYVAYIDFVETLLEKASDKRLFSN
jgi:hypothetical protein